MKLSIGQIVFFICNVDKHINTKVVFILDCLSFEICRFVLKHCNTKLNTKFRLLG